MNNGEKQYLIFLKYQREYLSRVTGYSKGYLSRIASGAKYPGDVFIGVCSHTLKEPAEELFRLIEPAVEPIVSARPDRSKQDLIETIDDLASRLTTAESEIKSLKAELRKYRG